jgi:hypothetical protein
MRISRREFSKCLSGAVAINLLNSGYTWRELSEQPVSDFCRSLEPIGRRLETRGYYVWGASPVVGEDGKIHVFYSRWPEKYRMGGWIHQSEIAHAVADTPESEFRHVDTVLSPREGEAWDSTTCHNPHIKKVEGKFCLFYMGNSNKKTNTKRIGLSTATSVYGPWHHAEQPLLDASADPEAWDSHCTTNPGFLKHPSGQYWLYYKSWNTYDYENYTDPKIRGNRKYGLAIADQPQGPYRKYEGNPVVDYSGKGNNIQAEDGFVWYENGIFKMILRDMGFFNHQYGLYIESKNGLDWTEPKIAYYDTDHYFSQPPKPKHLSKYGRFERPQLLIQDGKPTHLFVTTQGGKYVTSSPFIFRLKS